MCLDEGIGPLEGVGSLQYAQCDPRLEDHNGYLAMATKVVTRPPQDPLATS